MPGTKERSRLRPGASNGNGAAVDSPYHDHARPAVGHTMNGSSHRSFVYDVDHLATYTVGASHGLLYAEDGMRKLRVMENTTGIWTMRCRLLLDEQQVTVLDKQTGEEMERYHWAQVSDPTAIISNDRSEVFNNILLFTVHEDRSRADAISEMHIFQAISRPARDLVEDIKAAQMGRISTAQSSQPPGSMDRLSQRPSADPRYTDPRKSRRADVPWRTAAGPRLGDPGPGEFYHSASPGPASVVRVGAYL